MIGEARGERIWCGRFSLAVTLLVAAPAALAQPWTPLGMEFQVNASTTGHQREPSVATDADGNFVVVWDGEGLGDTYGVQGQLFASDGSPQGGEFFANSGVAGVQREASVGRADNGDFVVVWNDSFMGDEDVWAQRFASSGSPLGGNFRINDTVDPDQRRNDLAVFPDGRFIVVWTAAEEDIAPAPGVARGGVPGNSEVIGRRFSSDGTALASEFVVNTYTTDRQLDAAIGAARDGRFVVVWESYGQDGDLTGIFGQRFLSDGTKVGAEFQVNTWTTHFQYTADVDLNEDGRFVVVWSSKYQDGDSRGVFAQRFDSEGTRQGSEFRVNSYTTGIQGQPAVLASSGGGFLIAWEGPEVHAELHGKNGDPIGGEFVVNSYTTSLQGDPALAGDPDGQFVVSWLSFGQDDDVLGIFARRFMGKVFIDDFESAGTGSWSTAFGAP